MSQTEPINELMRLLREMVHLASQEPTVLEAVHGAAQGADHPGASHFDPERLVRALAGQSPNAPVGWLVLTKQGATIARQGLAKSWPVTSKAMSSWPEPIQRLVEAAWQGRTTSLFYDSVRVFGLPLKEGQAVTLLLVEAVEESAIRRTAARDALRAEVLTRVGKQLTMHQNLKTLGFAALHEIVSTLDLAAAMLWVHNAETNDLRLTSTANVHRQAVAELQVIQMDHGTSCLAEFAASARKVLSVEDVFGNVMTAELEAKACYLPPCAAIALPLQIGDRLIGVLELVAKAGDDRFLEQEGLVRTVAEHMALALNGALLYDSLERLATHDALTGLANHRTMNEFLHRKCLEHQRNGLPVGVIMIDVDHFRAFNEEEGHDTGDRVLRLVAESIGRCIRATDLAARYGGEEFTVLLPETTPHATANVAERIRQEVEAREFTTSSGQVRHLSVSVGYAIYPANADEPGSILRAADQALFFAKRSGRNRVCAYEGQYHDDLHLPMVLTWQVDDFIMDEDRERADTVLESVQLHIARLEQAIPLSQSQAHLLRLVMKYLPTYRRHEARGEPGPHGSSPTPVELRAILPSLELSSKRFDEEGTRLPLLARAAAILEAVADGGSKLLTDPHRFDPGLVRLVVELLDAA